MSHDFEVVTSDPPADFRLVPFLAQHSAELRRSDPHHALVQRDGRGVLSIDGPFVVEAEDLGDELLAATLLPRWLVQISVPASSRARPLGRKLAQHIAESARGAVWDPQAARILWPRAGSGRFAAPAGKVRAALVGMEWFLPPAVAKESDALRLVEILGRHARESLPVRYGGFEPPQGRWEPGREQAFATAWREEAWENDDGCQFGGGLHWKSRPPFFGGGVLLADLRSGQPAHHKPEGSASATRLSLSMDGRALASDTRWIELAVRLFADMAGGMEAFYAAAYLERDWIVSRTGLWSDSRTRTFALQRSQFWCGLPPRPTWLAWFGGAYRKELGRLPGAEERSRGSLVRASPSPFDEQSAFPELPSRLLARETGESVEPAAFVPDLTPD